jgi:hypothetical protein
MNSRHPYISNDMIFILEIVKRQHCKNVKKNHPPEKVKSIISI